MNVPVSPRITLLPEGKAPAGYGWAMLLVIIMSVIGYIAFAVGIVIFFLNAEKNILLALTLAATPVGVGFVLLVQASVLRLFCGIAWDVYYLVALKKHELRNQDQSTLPPKT